MNINIGDSNHIVRYIQSFLQENHNSEIILTGTYDYVTHNNFIDYMLSPDTKRLDYIKDKIEYDYPFIYKNFKFLDGYEELIMTSKTQQYSSEIEIYMTENRTNLLLYCDDLGWEVTEYNSYDAPYKIVLKSKNIKSPFPKEEFLSMLNLFDSKFYHGMAIRDNAGINDIVHENIANTGRTYKICVIKVKPYTTYTIAHNASMSARLVIGTTIAGFTKIEGVILKDVVDIQLNPGFTYEYTTTSSAKYMLIQIDSEQLISDNNDKLISKLLVFQGVDRNVPISSFINNPWYIHDKFVGHIINYCINSNSRDDDINYVQDMIRKINTKYKDYIPSVYQEIMKKTISDIQNEYNIVYENGYVDSTTENILNDFVETREEAE